MRTKKFLLLLLTLSFIFLLAACDYTDTSQPTQQPAQAPVTPTPTESVAQQANDAVQSANLAGTNVKVSLSGSDLTVSEDLTQYEIGGNGLIVDNIKQGCYDMQKAVWTSSVSKHLNQVKLNVTMDTQDQYGKVYHNTLVGYCMLTQKTASLFQWDNLSREDAWKVYDSTWLISFLTQ